MADVHVIGDEIHFDGYLVAILVATGIPASTLAEFEHGMNSGELFDGESCHECDGERDYVHKKTCSHYESPEGCGGPAPTEEESEYDCAMDDLVRSIKPFNKGGLVRYEDLERVIAQLKEEKEVEATSS